MVSKESTVVRQLSADWRQAGIAEGDAVLLHSNVSRTFRRARKLDPEIQIADILESFIQAVGSAGTLLMPLFNFDFTKGTVFDVAKSPSQMGALTETARLHPDSVRTGHPIYSFAVIGKNAESFRGLENISGYGPDSPFAALRKLGGKVAVLDLPDQNSMTFYHHVEEMEKVDYRYHKGFSGPYVDGQGRQSTRTFKLFVRNVERGVATHVDPMGEELWRLGLYTGNRPNEANGLRVVSAEALYAATTDVIRSGKAEGMLFKIERPTEGSAP